MPYFIHKILTQQVVLHISFFPMTELEICHSSGKCINPYIMEQIVRNTAKISMCKNSFL